MLTKKFLLLLTGFAVLLLACGLNENISNDPLGVYLAETLKADEATRAAKNKTATQKALTPTVPPTDTPIPTQTPTPEPIASYFSDEIDDAFVCAASSLIADPQVDIEYVQFSLGPSTLNVLVKMQGPMVVDFSFATVLTLKAGDFNEDFVYEDHDGSALGGWFDANAGYVKSGSSGGAIVIVDHENAQIGFQIEMMHDARGSLFDESGPPPPFTFAVNNYHMPTSNSDKTCDVLEGSFNWDDLGPPNEGAFP